MQQARDEHRFVGLDVGDHHVAVLAHRLEHVADLLSRTDQQLAGDRDAGADVRLRHCAPIMPAPSATRASL
jgi:hypothetical protein